MPRTITSTRMTRADRLSASRYGIPVLLLMENAGRAVAEAAEAFLKKQRTGRVIVLCGGGNNGGDGIAAARTLQNRGYRVETWLLKNPEAWKGSLALHSRMAKSLGVRFKRFEKIPSNQRPTRLHSARLVIDALLGTGTQGEIRDPYAAAIRLINQARRAVIAVDIPSGLNADTGQPLGPCVNAVCTVTMSAAKPGLINPSAKKYVGRLIIAEIGIPSNLL